MTNSANLRVAQYGETGDAEGSDESLFRILRRTADLNSSYRDNAVRLESALKSASRPPAAYAAKDQPVSAPRESAPLDDSRYFSSKRSVGRDLNLKNSDYQSLAEAVKKSSLVLKSLMRHEQAQFASSKSEVSRLVEEVKEEKENSRVLAENMRLLEAQVSGLRDELTKREAATNSVIDSLKDQLEEKTYNLELAEQWLAYIEKEVNENLRGTLEEANNILRGASKVQGA